MPSRSRPPGVWCVGVLSSMLLCVLSASSIALAQSADATSIATAVLARPISPGAIALLVEISAVPAAQARLSSALENSNADVRAAAARVIFVSGVRQLAPAVAHALASETNGPAAFEEARVVANFGSPADPVIRQAVMRLDPEPASRVALAMASARGTSAMDIFPILRMHGVSEQDQADFVRLATRGDRNALVSLASDAARDSDAALLAATLTAARDAKTDMPPEVLDSVFVAESSEIRRVAIWHMLRTWDGVTRLPDRMKAAVTAALRTAPEQPDALAMLGVELAARTIGHPARADAAWNAMIAAPPRQLGEAFRVPGVRALLTDRERQAAGRALFDDPRSLSKPESKDAAKPPTAGADRPMTLLRTATGYPHGFMSGVFAETGCDPTVNAAAGGGEVLLRREGRAQRITLVDLAASGCARAARDLVMAYTTDPSRLIAQDDVDLVIVPYDADFVACYESAGYQPPTSRLGEGRILPPRKTKDVRPVYPDSAIAARVNGTVVLESVITTTGCVSRAAVVRGIDPRLDWAALRAVLGWKFSPASIADTPVTAIMTVTVQFQLN